MTDSASQPDVTFQVPDMTCSHCVGVIRTAVEDALPGTDFDVDLDSHRVTVPADMAAAAENAIRDAGYDPMRVA